MKLSAEAFLMSSFRTVKGKMLPALQFYGQQGRDYEEVADTFISEQRLREMSKDSVIEIENIFIFFQVFHISKNQINKLWWTDYWFL